MSIPEKPLTRTFPISSENGKGGEKEMVSDWEELESWSKEDLIIELMHMRTIYSMLRSEQGDDCRWPEMEVKAVEDDVHWEPGQLTTDAWAERIAIYAAARATEDFYGCDLIDYGLTDGQGYDVVDRLHAEGRLVLPPGVKFYDPEEYRCPSPCQEVRVRQEAGS